MHPMFTAAWLTMNCQDTEVSIKRWMKKEDVYTQAYTHTRTHTMDYYSAIKKKLYFAICKNMDRLEVHYVKWNKSEKDK